MKAIKKNMNKWLGLVLAVAMVFSLNLTSMTAKAATTYTLPTETTEQEGFSFCMTTPSVPYPHPISKTFPSIGSRHTDFSNTSEP